uniref:WD_REPEATS_REGION domain-containing protein n=1 Tax=Macrostomum lignano TaxID=282301 RepID=A0A1I8FME1_9PLAT
MCAGRSPGERACFKSFDLSSFAEAVVHRECRQFILASELVHCQQAAGFEQVSQHSASHRRTLMKAGTRYLKMRCSACLVARREKSSSSKRRWRSGKTYGGLNRRGKIDSSQPVTFRNKIKSSGYGAAAPRQPPSRRRQAPQKLPLSSPARSSGTGSLHRLLRLLQPNSAQQQPQAPSRIAVTIRPTDAGTSPPVTRLRLLPLCRSRDAGLLLCCAANGTARSVRGREPGIRGDERAAPRSPAGWRELRSAPCCRLNGDKVLTASSDGACRVWSLATGRQLLELGELRRASGQQPKCRPAELTHAQFYFLDKFLLLSQGNRIRLFACHLGDGSEKRDDVRTYSSAAGRCKEALSLSVPDCQQVTACGGLNSVHSYCILAACSDRVVRLFDLNSRQPGCLATYVEEAGSQLAAGPPAFTVLPGTGWTFLTAARGGTAGGGHPNPAERLPSQRLSLRPCAGSSSYADDFACGTEDRRVAFFDARSLNRPVSTVSGFGDCVTAIDCRADGVC